MNKSFNGKLDNYIKIRGWGEGEIPLKCGPKDNACHTAMCKKKLRE